LRKALSILFVLLFAGSLMAQVRTGNLYGKVTDEDGNPLPGVTVTLSGARTAPLTSITSAEGIYRFLSLPPARDYVIRCELGGFKLEERTGIIVVVGANVELNVTMAMGAIEEEVTVTAVSPVVDTKKTAVGQNVTQDVLQSLPTARDPWVVLQMAPSITVDRENIGGVESGQQSSYVARGAGSYSNNVWAMDGIVITDPAAIGASPSYYDFDAFEEMQITVGGADVTVQTGGVALNMVTRRGGNKVTLGGRFYMVDEKFQAKNTDYVEEVRLEEPTFLGVNLIRNNKDYGFNLGGPLVKDKAWLWGSYGVQDIKTTTVYQEPDDTLLVNYAAKLNVQIVPENRFEAFMHVGGKNKWGRSSSASLPGGYYQGGRYHFGSPILKFQDEHMFGDNLFVSLKYAFSDAGFNLTPMDDRDFVNPVAIDIARGGLKEAPNGLTGADRYYVERPVNQYNFLLNYFNDSLFGVSHDIKVGIEYADRNAYTESVYPGNFYYNWNYNSDTIDLNALPAPYGTSTYDGIPDIPTDARNVKYFSYFKGYYRDYGVSALSAYLSDTITFGRFNLLLGLRYDRQVPRINPSTILTVTDNPAWTSITGGDTAISDTLGNLLQGLDITDEYQTLYDVNGDKWGWTFWSPRLGITWDITGDGKTIGKASFAMYGDFMGTSSYNKMPGGTGGWIDFWWMDSNKDEQLEFTELYWRGTGSGLIAEDEYMPYNVFDAAGNFLPDADHIEDAYNVGWGGVADWATRNELSAPYDDLDPSYGSSRTSEFMLTVEREIFTDFAVSVNATYRRYDHFNWRVPFFPVGGTNYYQQSDWFVSATSILSDANVPGSVPIDPLIDTLWDGNTGEASQHDWYVYDDNYTASDGTNLGNVEDGLTAYDLYERQPGYNREFYGVDIIFTKRLSDKWMLNGSLTWQHQLQHYGEGSYFNDTNLWAIDGRAYAPSIGGASGKINQYTYSRWLIKVGGLYQLPYDINVSFTFLAREGWPLEERIRYYDYGLPNTRSRSYVAYIHPFGEFRLNTFYRFDFRLEKVINLGDTGRIYLMADLFNVFNAKLENRRYQRIWGSVYRRADRTYYFSTYYASGSAYGENAYTLNEILNPRVLRFGVRFQF
jgi:hypothetical protein